MAVKCKAVNFGLKVDNQNDKKKSASLFKFKKHIRYSLQVKIVVEKTFTYSTYF